MFHIGDKFLIRGLESEVRYVNNNKAWLAPTKTTFFEGEAQYSFCTFEVIDERLIDSTGTKAISITNTLCGAV